jgi:hypothetical protein
LKQEAFAAKFNAADALYSRLLILLIGELNGAAPTVRRS